MKFTKLPQVVEATQWFKNGDHPLDYAVAEQGFENGELREFSGEYRREHNWEGSIVRYFRRPDMPDTQKCEYCGKEMLIHGWVDGARNGGAECTVCPGDWIITGVGGEIYPCKPALFAKYYRPAEKADIVPEITMQQMIDVGLNAFGLQLFVESIAGKNDAKSFDPFSFKYKGVKVTLQPDGEVDTRHQ